MAHIWPLRAVNHLRVILRVEKSYTALWDDLWGKAGLFKGGRAWNGLLLNGGDEKRNLFPAEQIRWKPRAPVRDSFSVPSPLWPSFKKIRLSLLGTGIKFANFYLNCWLRLVLVVNGLPMRAFLFQAVSGRSERSERRVGVIFLPNI